MELVAQQATIYEGCEIVERQQNITSLFLGSSCCNIDNLTKGVLMQLTFIIDRLLFGRLDGCFMD
jgi:hypothetical protein